MFEKEAEEYADDKCGTIETDEKMFCKLDFQNGAWFGYNKANEWHKEELPEVTEKNKGKLYLAWTKYGRAGSPAIVTPLKAKYMNLWTGAIIDKEDVVSWKEIELPTE